MSRIVTADHLIRFLDSGELGEELDRELRRVLATLRELTAYHPKAKAKGKLSLELAFAVENGTVQISASIKAKLPEPARATSFAWILEDGTLSTEHPKQLAMFPAAVRSDAAE